MQVGDRVQINWDTYYASQEWYRRKGIPLDRQGTVKHVSKTRTFATVLWDGNKKPVEVALAFLQPAKGQT